MATAPPVGVSPKDWRRYQRAIRKIVMPRLLRDVNRSIRQAGRDYVAIRQAIANIPNDPTMIGLVGAAARQQALILKTQHTTRFRRSMRTYLGVNFGLAETPAIASFMDDFIERNVNLIKTVPPRLHQALIADIRQLIQQDQSFDQQALAAILKQRYNSAGYNLRRITRDQTNKAIGQLNGIRQTQVGITHYRWETAGDSRVRPDHMGNDGRTFAWARVPHTGHPGEAIQCRCVAVAIIPDAPQRRAAAFQRSNP